jgi:Acyl-CoA carboxylase epsilon subunit
VSDQPTPATDTPAASMRIVAGNPTDDELAAAHSVIVAVLAEQAARGAELLEPPVDRWRLSARAMRGSIAPGAGAWAASGGLRGY